MKMVFLGAVFEVVFDAILGGECTEEQLPNHASS